MGSHRYPYENMAIFRSEAIVAAASETPNIENSGPCRSAWDGTRGSRSPDNWVLVKNHRKTIGKWRFTLWLCQIAIENGHKNS